MWRIEFVSADFLPTEPEELQVNPGLYGVELAQWLSQALAERGFRTAGPEAEDWGWLLQYTDGADTCMIGCGSICEPGEGYAGKPITWSIFVDRKKRWFRRTNSNSSVQRIGDAILAVLSARAITDVQQVEV